ncbi:MAG: cupin domain-containing protein [Dehalococcoidia bacterium]|nr:cupin domain-containing protein [Dehalococcoidia bacterium]
MTENVNNNPSADDLPPAVPEFTGEVTSPPRDARFVTRSKESVEPTITRNLAIKRMFQASEGIFESSFQFSLFNKLPVGETNVRHVHDDVEKIYYFITGNAEIDCGPWRKNVQAGDFLFFPAAIPHQIRNTGSLDLEFIVVAAKTLDTAKGMENGGLIELSDDS